MHFVLLGRTGSGKSTVAKELLKSIDVPLVSSGKIARELSSTDPATDLALQQGGMAPEAAMRHSIRIEIEAAEIQHGGWILDGFPRTVEQLILLSFWTTAMPIFVNLEVEPLICIERLAKRQRVDDNADSIAAKFKTFTEKTQPMIDILNTGGRLLTVPYEMESRYVAERILSEMR